MPRTSSLVAIADHPRTPLCRTLVQRAMVLPMILQRSSEDDCSFRRLLLMYCAVLQFPPVTAAEMGAANLRKLPRVEDGACYSLPLRVSPATVYFPAG